MELGMELSCPKKVRFTGKNLKRCLVMNQSPGYVLSMRYGVSHRVWRSPYSWTRQDVCKSSNQAIQARRAFAQFAQPIPNGLYQSLI